MALEIWDIWYPNAGAQGLSFCRARIEHAERVFLHAAPDSLRVEVRDDDGSLLAFGDQLTRAGGAFTMTCLTRDGGRVTREDGWPRDDDLGSTVLLPGGEAGILKSWWNAVDGSEWRWTLEFYNRK